jgi:hypothetical protein
MNFLDLGFETCGNATLIAYENSMPVLVTDPWIAGRPYFGSWSMPHKFQDRQVDAIKKAKFVWLSHGHPDHVNQESLEILKSATFLIPAHCNKRILNDLQQQGINAIEVKTNEWMQLSDNIRIITFPDWNQDAACIIAIGNKTCILNLNDGSASGSDWYIKKHLAEFQTRFCLALINYNDADMFNYFTDDGSRINPHLLGLATPGTALGPQYSSMLKKWNCTHTAPFSNSHCYSRTDSAWASKYETPYEMHGKDFDEHVGTFLPGYFNYSAINDEINVVKPQVVNRVMDDPSAFGDDWSETLDQSEKSEVTQYFQKFSALHKKFGFVNLRVGKRDHFINLRGPKDRGITFEAPRGSLMTAVRYNIFDDLLIGNFIKTTLHGKVSSLYPDFSPYVAKYGDNGLAYSEEDLERYFRYYHELYGFRYWLAKMEFDSVNRVRALLANHPARPTIKRLYHAFR